MRVAATLTLLCAGSAMMARGDPAPSPPLRAQGAVMDGMGLNIHDLRQPQAELSRIAGAGVKWVRFDVSWAQTEQVAGQYDWRRTDDRIRAITAAGMRPILVLAYGNRLYGGAGVLSAGVPAAAAPPGPPPLPLDDAAVDAYARWTAAAAVRYARYGAVLELWNEPNNDQFWPPRADAAAYLRLANAACRAIRARSRAATVWAPGLASSDHRDPADRSAFLGRLVADPLPRCLSAISIHPYLFWGSIDGAPAFWQRVRATVAVAGRPVVSSESGISSYRGGVSPDMQASYLVRMRLYDHMAGVPVSVWYDWRNNGAAPADPEDNYGLLDADGAEKPALAALRVLSTQLRGRTRQCMVRSASQTTLFAWDPARPDDQLVVAWPFAGGGGPGLRGSVTVQLPADAAAPAARDLYGAPLPVTALAAGRGAWGIQGIMPAYIHYRGGRPQVCA